MMQQNEHRPTLGVAKVTQRVLDNRHKSHPSHISFGKFRKGLVRVYEFDLLALRDFPKGFWAEQYAAYMRGDRSANIHDSTLLAFEWCRNHYNTETA
jgi:hypothetical protein